MTQVIDFIGGEYRNRTGVHGFAIRCVTTPPTRLCGLNQKPNRPALWAVDGVSVYQSGPQPVGL